MDAFDFTVASGRPCIDPWPRTVGSLTPDVWGLSDRARLVTTHARIGLHMYRARTRAVEIGLDGGTERWSATTSRAPPTPDGPAGGPMRIADALDLDAHALAGLFTAGFEGYTIPIIITPAYFGLLARLNHFDLGATRVAYDEAGPTGLAIVATRGRTARIAAMGVIESARRTGVGRRLLAAVLHDARARGFDRVVLEVIADNDPAIALYAGAGFVRTRRLIGWTAPPAPGRPESLDVIDPTRVARGMYRWGPTDLPWQIAPETIAAYGAPTLGLALDDRAVALVDPSKNAVTLLALAGATAEDTGCLLAALQARYSERKLQTPIVVPEDHHAALFTAAGFERGPLSQFEMVRPVERPAR